MINNFYHNPNINFFEKSGRNLVPQQLALKHTSRRPANQPTVGLDKFEPSKQTGDILQSTALNTYWS